jgi:DnaJ-class molecular chaperone
MHAETANAEPQVLPAVAHLAVPRGFTSHQCPDCRGTGTLGRREELHAVGGALFVTTRTHWCHSCRGGGLIWKAERRTA